MRAALTALLLLAACAVPQLDVPNQDAIAHADYPRLIPSARIAARADAQPARITEATTAALRARAADLQRRAALMRRAALTDAERDRLRAALARLRRQTAAR